MNKPLVTKGPPRIAVMIVRSHLISLLVIYSHSQADTYLVEDATQAEILRRGSPVGGYARDAYNCDAKVDLTGLP